MNFNFLHISIFLLIIFSCSEVSTSKVAADNKDSITGNGTEEMSYVIVDAIIAKKRITAYYDSNIGLTQKNS